MAQHAPLDPALTADRERVERRLLSELTGAGQVLAAFEKLLLAAVTVG